MANVTVNGTPYTGVDEVLLPITNGGGLEQRFVIPLIEPLSVTENGTYTAPSGVDGYSPVTVNVIACYGTALYN